MSSTFLIRLIRLFTTLIFQVLVFNNIHLFGYITPLVIGYMLVCFHHNTSRTGLLVWGFVTGILFDIFSNTAGMASAACTLMAMLQPTILNLFAPRDASEDFTPSFLSMGFFNYLTYVLILMFLLHGVFYLLDAFTLVEWSLTIMAIFGGTILTTLIIIFIELLVRSKKRKK